MISFREGMPDYWARNLPVAKCRPRPNHLPDVAGYIAVAKHHIAPRHRHKNLHPRFLRHLG